jgi:hypothetical protein
VSYLTILPDDDPNMDQNIQQSQNKTSITQRYMTDLIFYKFVLLTAKKPHHDTQQEANNKDNLNLHSIMTG